MESSRPDSSGARAGQVNEAPQPPSVFVLMPFDPSFSDVYDALIKAPLEAVGFSVRRADSLFNQQQILKDVVKGIADATLVVADVTDLNENVLYELGLAHALGKRTVMVTQNIEELPFDLRPYRANEYSMLFNRADDLKQLMTDIGNAVLTGNADFSNPVQDFAPYALRHETQVASTQAVGPSAEPRSGSGEGRNGEEAEEEDEPGLLERIVAMERGGEVATTLAVRIGELTEAIGQRFTEHSERLNRAEASLGDRAAGARLAIARDAARDLNTYAEQMESLTADLRESLTELTAGANSIARHGGINDAEDAAAVESMLETLQQAEAGMAGGRTEIANFGQILLDMPNMERNLHRATRRGAKVVMATAEEIQNGESEFARARGLLEERLGAYRGNNAA